MKTNALYSVVLISLLNINLKTDAAPASSEIKLICATQHLTFSYVLKKTSNGFHLDGVQHHGAEFVPVHDGLITAFDLPYLAKKAELFKNIGDRFEISFGAEDCTRVKNDWTCRSRRDLRIGNLQVQTVGFTLREQRLHTGGRVYDSYRADLSFLVANIGYSIPMTYTKSDCVSR